MKPRAKPTPNRATIPDRIAKGLLSAEEARAELEVLDRNETWYEPRPNLKHETVEELEAIRRRIVAAAGMVC
jgi:hypothetical protein